jgi:hypothetical protein
MKRETVPAILIAAALCASCSPGASLPAQQTEELSLAGQWNEQVLLVVTQEKPGPPIAARFMALVHTAMYDAWTAYDDKAVPVYGSKAVPLDNDEAAKRIAISYAASEAIISVYPQRQAQVYSFMSLHGLTPGSNSNPSQIGRAAARRVIEAFRQDGSNQDQNYADPTGYRPVNTVDKMIDPNHWQPYPFVMPDGSTVVRDFIAPHWGRVKPFAIQDVPAERPPAPAFYPSQKYTTQAEEIISLTANLTEKQKVIAEYWADGPSSVLPPGHWALFGQQISRRDRHTVDEDVKLFFLIGNAMHDAAICCWDAKRYYDYIRPMSAIRYLKKGQMIPGWLGPGKGFGMVKGEEWIPYQPANFITPPFAEYTSGHSTFSAAGAEILKRFTGSDSFGGKVVVPAGGLRVEPGVAPAQEVTLSWPTFSAAADEAGMSRRLGGIHFEDGDLYGRKGGRRIGSLVWDKAQSLFSGQRP